MPSYWTRQSSRRIWIAKQILSEMNPMSALMVLGWTPPEYKVQLRHWPWTWGVVEESATHFHTKIHTMTSSNGNISRVIGLLCGEFTGELPHKGLWRRALMFSLICAWTGGWVDNRHVSDWRRHRAHYEVTVMGVAWWTSRNDRTEHIRGYATHIMKRENKRQYNFYEFTCLVSIWGTPEMALSVSHLRQIWDLSQKFTLDL